MKKISAQLDKTKALKKKLLTVYLEEKIVEEDYQQTSAEYAHRITDLERQLRDVSNMTPST